MSSINEYPEELRAFVKPIHAYARQLFSDRDLREDAVQEMWLELLSEREARPDKPASYHFTAARRAALRFKQRRAHDGPYDRTEQRTRTECMVPYSDGLVARESVDQKNANLISHTARRRADGKHG